MDPNTTSKHFEKQANI